MKKEKAKFEKKVADYCYTIQAVNKNTAEDGKRKIGVYSVLDKEGDVNQQGLFDAIDRVSEMHRKNCKISDRRHSRNERFISYTRALYQKFTFSTNHEKEKHCKIKSRELTLSSAELSKDLASG